MRRKFEWTPEHVATLKSMWEGGAAASEIATKIGGITRCAVLGKVHRLKLPLRDLRIALSLANNARLRKERAKGIVRQMPGRTLACNPAEPHKRSQPGKRIAPLPIPPEGPKSACPVKFEDLEPHSCRFGHGDPKEPGFTFCGCPVIPGTSWCETHHAKVFNRVEVVRRRHYEIVRQPTFYELEIEKA